MDYECFDHVEFMVGSLKNVLWRGSIIKVNKKTYKIRFMWNEPNQWTDKLINKGHVIRKISGEDVYNFMNQLEDLHYEGIPFSEFFKKIDFCLQ